MLEISLAGRRLEYAARLAVPYMILALLTLLSVAALQIPGAGMVKPYLVLMAVYYWAINRPTLVHPALCFGLGLFLDIMSGVPLGVNALVLVAVRWLVSEQRRFLMGQPYITIWAIFVLVTLFAAAMQWLLMSFSDGSWVPFLPAAISALISMLVFPFVSLALFGAHRLLPTGSRG